MGVAFRAVQGDISSVAHKAMQASSPRRSASARSSSHFHHHDKHSPHHDSGMRFWHQHAPQTAPQGNRASAKYDRPWLQKKAGENGEHKPCTKAEQKRLKDIAKWWKQEAERMKNAVSKLNTHSEQLTGELSGALQSTRHWQYELGVAQAALDRQQEQATATMEKRRQLEEEVSRLRDEKEQYSFQSYEKSSEMDRLSEEVQELEDQIAELRKHKAQRAERAQKRAQSHWPAARESTVSDLGTVSEEAERRGSMQQTRQRAARPVAKRALTGKF